MLCYHVGLISIVPTFQQDADRAAWQTLTCRRHDYSSGAMAPCHYGDRGDTTRQKSCLAICRTTARISPRASPHAVGLYSAGRVTVTKESRTDTCAHDR